MPPQRPRSYPVRQAQPLRTLPGYHTGGVRHRPTRERHARAKPTRSQPASYAGTPPPDEPSNVPLDSAARHVDVFVDDFIRLVQGSRRHILHAIDMVLDQPLPGETLRNEAASLKKLLQGDGYWDTRKFILGWIIDTLRGTLELPAHRVQRLHDIFASLRGKQRMSMRKWQKVLGELRIMSIGVPGSEGIVDNDGWLPAQSLPKDATAVVYRVCRLATMG